LVNELQNGLFSELKLPEPKVEPLRRQLQRAYIDILNEEFNPAAEAAPQLPPMGPPSRSRSSGTKTSELRSVARISLERLTKEIAATAPKTKDPATQAHLKDLASQIQGLLEPKK
jgi:hypothetical protein